MRKTYKIKSGDTLGAIARRLGTTVKKLAELNGIKDVNKIRAGAALRLPVEAQQKWMSIQAKESGATLSGKRKTTTSAAVEERQRAYKALSDSSKAMGGSGAVLSGKAKKKTKASDEKPMPSTLPVAPPKGRKTKKKEKLYDTVDPKTGRVAKEKVTMEKHLANIEAAKKSGVLSDEAQFKRQQRALAAANMQKRLKKLVGSKQMAKGGYVNCGASVPPAQKSSRKK